ncbi:MAG: hypothetical protein R2932_16880 [Caldilineaceae bacterium]
MIEQQIIILAGCQRCVTETEQRLCRLGIKLIRRAAGVALNPDSQSDSYRDLTTARDRFDSIFFKSDDRPILRSPITATQPGLAAASVLKICRFSASLPKKSVGSSIMVRWAKGEFIGSCYFWEFACGDMLYFNVLIATPRGL